MRYQTQLRETIQAFEDEARSRAQIAEQVGISERKAAALSGEGEESKALLDGANRAIRQLQNDIADSRSAVNNMQTINARDMTGKRSLSNALGELEGRLSDAENVALKSGKSAMAKLEGKIRELEAELAATQSRTGEANKAYQRAERKT